jgi:hypothetical protein
VTFGPDIAALVATLCSALALTRLLAARAENRPPWAASAFALVAIAAAAGGLRADPGALEPERMAMTVIRLVAMAVN